MFTEHVIKVTTAGNAGAATGTADSDVINGEIEAVYLNYHASAPATTTVDLDEIGGSARKVLDKAASNTDVVHRPRAQAQDATGAVIAGVYDRIAIAGRRVRATVAASDALTDAVTVTLVVKE